LLVNARCGLVHRLSSSLSALNRESCQIIVAAPTVC
jgi:hypothetical protein